MPHVDHAHRDVTRPGPHVHPSTRPTTTLPSATPVEALTSDRRGGEVGDRGTVARAHAISRDDGRAGSGRALTTSVTWRKRSTDEWRLLIRRRGRHRSGSARLTRRRREAARGRQPVTAAGPSGVTSSTARPAARRPEAGGDRGSLVAAANDRGRRRLHDPRPLRRSRRRAEARGADADSAGTSTHNLRHSHVSGCSPLPRRAVTGPPPC